MLLRLGRDSSSSSSEVDSQQLRAVPRVIEETFLPGLARTLSAWTASGFASVSFQRDRPLTSWAIPPPFLETQ